MWKIFIFTIYNWIKCKESEIIIRKNGQKSFAFFHSDPQFAFWETFMHVFYKTYSKNAETLPFSCYARIFGSRMRWTLFHWFCVFFRWNQLDIGIVILSVVGIVLEELESKIIPINPTIIRVMRVLRIARGNASGIGIICL